MVARRTGLTTHVIRVWEKRYSAVVPKRTDTNRRLYSDADVERLRLLRDATVSGRSIGQIARLPTEELKSLISEDRQAGVGSSRPTHSAPVTDRQLLEQAIDAIDRFDNAALEQVFADAIVAFGQNAMIERVVLPLLHQIGDMWETGRIRIAHEHMASAVVRSIIGSFITGYSVPVSAPLALVATPVSQVHEYGALVVAAVAAAEGWRVTYLGPSLPAEEIAGVAISTGAAVVALSLIYPLDDPTVESEVNKLRKLLPEQTAVIVGGLAADRYREQFARIDVISLDNLGEFRARLRAIRQNR